MSTYLLWFTVQLLYKVVRNYYSGWWQLKKYVWIFFTLYLGKVNPFWRAKIWGSSWWRQTFLMFTPKIGKIFNLTHFFQMGWWKTTNVFAKNPTVSMVHPSSSHTEIEVWSFALVGPIGVRLSYLQGRHKSEKVLLKSFGPQKTIKDEGLKPPNIWVITL